MNKQKNCTFYIVRHGETEWNVKGFYQGSSDTPLNKLGEEQAKSLARKLEHIRFDAIFSSDLLRANKTAEALALERQMEVKTTEILRERSWGSLEGRSAEYARKELKDAFAKFETLSEQEKTAFKFVEDMESFDEVIPRFITFIRELAVAYAGKTVLVVCHGGIMRGFLIHLGFGTHKEFSGRSIENTGYFVLESDGVDFFVKETVGIHKK